MINATKRELLNKFAPYDPDLGELVNGAYGVVRLSYDFAVQGGAVGTVSLLDENGKPFLLPVGAIVTRSYIDVVTPATTSASGTIAISTGQTAADVLGATAAASFTGILEGVSTGTAANMKKISTSAKTPVAVIATGALTAGKAYVFLEYVLSSAT